MKQTGSQCAGPDVPGQTAAPTRRRPFYDKRGGGIDWPNFAPEERPDSPDGYRRFSEFSPPLTASLLDLRWPPIL